MTVFPENSFIKEKKFLYTESEVKTLPFFLATELGDGS